MDLEGGAEAEAGAGARQTCECVSSSVAEVVHSIQHLLLGAKVIQVPLGLGGSTVLSQTWKGRSPHSTVPSVCCKVMGPDAMSLVF